MTDTPGPPARPPAVRGVDADLDHGLHADASITHGQIDGQIEQRHQLAPWQRDTLVALSVGDCGQFQPQRKLLRTLAEAGLVEIVEIPIDAFVAKITPAGREALRRGWYPAA